MNILIIRLSSIGDCVLASSALAALRDRYPQARIVWAVQSKSLPVVQGLPGLDGTLVWDDRRGPWRSLSAALRRTRQERFDVALDLHGLHKAALFLIASHARRRITGSRSGPLSRWGANVVLREGEPVHARHFYLGRASLLDIAPDATERYFPSVPVTAEHRCWAAQFERDQGIEPGHRLVGLNLGASKPRNRWPAERFAQLARDLIADKATRVMVFGAPADAPLMSELEADLARLLPGASSARGPIVSAVGRVSLLQLAALAERCAAFVTADTGPMHIAAAVGAPVLALFGPADWQRTGPVHKPGNPPVRVLDARTVTGSWPAPMAALTVDSVREAVLELMEEGGGASRACAIAPRG